MNLSVEHAEGHTPVQRDEQSPDAFIASLYRLHAITLIRTAILLVGDQPSAEYVVQDAFFALQRGLPRLRDSEKALPYLRTSVVNGCRSVQRSRSRARRRPAVHHPPV
jgi:DNA-directed RNA polymerase specialized sigma24 family protein